MSKLSNNVMAGYVVKTDGEINVEETVQKFCAEVLNYKTNRELEAETVGNAVHAVFDEWRGVNINMPALQSAALNHLNFQPENHKSLSQRIAEYVRANAGARETGALFFIGKGKGGGVKRWSDQEEKTSE
jgi:broad specificity polyphosphatase/5'/3'-nucleotidase SurE